MSAERQNPVQAIYNELVTMKAHVFYLEWEQRRLQRFNFIIEVVLAVSTSSAVAGFWLWQSAIGADVWKSIGVAAALVAVVKPILNLSDKLKQVSELLTDARALHHELSTICVLIEQYDEFTDELRQRFFKSFDYKGNFIKSYKDGTANRAMIDHCMKRALEIHPPARFYIPSAHE